MHLLESINLDNLTTEQKAFLPFSLGVHAVLSNKGGEIAFLHNVESNYHLLPGGAVEKKEDVQDVLTSECLRQTGQNINILEAIGATIEYRKKDKFTQETHCYLAKVTEAKVPDKREGNEKKNPPTPSDGGKEEEESLELSWTTLSEAISLTERDSSHDYIGKFISARTLVFLKEAKRLKEAS